MIANPAIISSMNITIALPTVEIANTQTTIYNNTFDLSYNVTNLGDENKIVLYNGDTRIDNITDPYTFTDLNDGVYTFKLEIENDNMIANPAIISSMNITIALPTVEIANTQTTIYNNTFDLSYNVTNLGDENKIVLYNGDTRIDNITDPYTFTDLNDGVYTFKLEIENDNMIANPVIDSEKQVTIKVPTVEITSPSTDTTVNNDTFIIKYNVANIPDAYTLVLYETILDEATTTTLNNNCDKQIGSNTVTVESPTTTSNYTYTLKILNASGEDATILTSNQDTISVTIPKPILLVNNATINDSEDDYTYYYFKQTTNTCSFTLRHSHISTPIDILLVGGGGQGGSDGGYWGSGGGGAGAYVTKDINPIINTTYEITIGSGGYGNWSAGNGDNSSIKQGSELLIEAYGGGRGCDNGGTVNGNEGSVGIGSGGGGSGTATSFGPVGNPGGTGGTVYVNRGGSGQKTSGSNPRRGGGWWWWCRWKW